MRRRTIISLLSLPFLEATYLTVQNDRRPTPTARKQLPFGWSLHTDLHVHLAQPSNYPKHELLQTLSGGITGITENWFKETMSFDTLLKDPSICEYINIIDNQGMARVDYQGNTGYVLRTQEIEVGYHLLGVGCVKRIPQRFPLLEDNIKNIHDAGGLAVLCHPQGMSNQGFPPYRFATPDDEKCLYRMLESKHRVDEIETFNAQLVNLLPIGMHLEDSNGYAQQLAKRHGFKGIANSDTHTYLDQVHRAGIYIPEGNMSVRYVQHCILNGNFEAATTKISHWSFGKGHILGHLLARPKTAI